MSVFNTIDTFVQEHQLMSQEDRVIVGLSGGPDSVFLLYWLKHFFKEYPQHVIVAHLNHQWRAEADMEEQFCKKLCEKLGFTFVSTKAHELPLQKTTHVSKEAFGRALRRYYFTHLKKSYNAQRIVLAHHADDHIETFFIRLLRGSSLTGLCGLWPEKDGYVRPLLCLHKDAILQYLATHDISYCIDASNESPDFLRNRIRQSLLPLLNAIDSRAPITMLNTIEKLQEAELFLENKTKEILASIAHQENNHYHVNRAAFMQQDLFMQKRIIVTLLAAKQTLPFAPTSALIDEIVRFLKQPGSGSHKLHETITLIKTNETWYFA